MREIIDIYTHRPKPNRKHLQKPEKSIEAILGVRKGHSWIPPFRVFAVDDPIEDAILRENFCPFEFFKCGSLDSFQQKILYLQGSEVVETAFKEFMPQFIRKDDSSEFVH